MDERQDVQPKDKNIAQLMVKLATVQAQIKLVQASLYMNKQKATINKKMKEFKDYAEGQAEKYSQNAEEATKAMDDYKSAVEEAMKQYDNDYLKVMHKHDIWQEAEAKHMAIEKQVASELKEQRKTQEYKDWAQEVKNLNREIKANANNPAKLASLAEDLKSLHAKDPTLPRQVHIEHIKQDIENASRLVKFYDKELEEIQAERDDKLNELLENKETSLAKIQKQNVFQKLVARFTSKSKSFKNNVVTPIANKASKIKNEKIPDIKKERKAKQEARKEKREETIGKMKDFKDGLGKQVNEAKDSTVDLAKRGIRAVVEFGREAKKTTVRTIEGIGTRIGDTKEKIQENLSKAVDNSSQTLDDLKGDR